MIFKAIVVPVLALLSLTTAVYAQKASPPGAKSDLIRVKYSNTKALPDDVAFLATMQFVYAVNMNDSDVAVGYVKQGMGLDDIEAQEFLALLLATFASVNTEVESMRYDLACASGAPKVSGAQVYRTLEAIDDIPEHVAAVHLRKLRTEIGPDKTKRLEQWLDSKKLFRAAARARLRPPKCGLNLTQIVSQNRTFTPTPKS